MAIATVNPATGETIKTFEPLDPAEVDSRIARAAAAFEGYRLTSYADRAGWLRAAGEILDSDTDRFAELMTLEMGKTLKAAGAEVAKCAKACRFYADHAEDFLADEPADPGAVGAVRAYARYQPLGPVLAIMPWNFPFWQAMRFAAPALMAGNVGLLKHASNVPQTAMALEDVFRRAGFPADVFQTLLIGSDAVEQVLRDDRVVAATLTGSTPAGRSVAATAGERLKHTVLELGGSDPFLVLPSADLERSASVAVTARCQNNGQSCIAAKRFIVHEQVADEWERLFAEKMRALVLGDPRDEGTDVGPLATEQGRDGVAALVEDARAKGATITMGGDAVDKPGWWYPPTVVTGITREMDLYAEEVFGPVALLFRVPDLDAAIELANDTEFGLSSNVWTSDGAEQERCIRDLRAGQVFVNGMTVSFPELPFGGIKNSGTGRELAAHGIREFTNIKTVWIGDSAAADTGAK